MAFGAFRDVKPATSVGASKGNGWFGRGLPAGSQREQGENPQEAHELESESDDEPHIQVFVSFEFKIVVAINIARVVPASNLRHDA